jgi:hypothetical protein
MTMGELTSIFYSNVNDMISLFHEEDFNGPGLPRGESGSENAPKLDENSSETNLRGNLPSQKQQQHRAAQSSNSIDDEPRLFYQEDSNTLGFPRDEARRSHSASKMDKLSSEMLVRGKLPALQQQQQQQRAAGNHQSSNTIDDEARVSYQEDSNTLGVLREETRRSYGASKTDELSSGMLVRGKLPASSLQERAAGKQYENSYPTPWMMNQDSSIEKNQTLWEFPGKQGGATVLRRSNALQICRRQGAWGRSRTSEKPRDARISWENKCVPFL